MILIDRMFDGLIKGLKNYLPDFGMHVAIDSKKVKRYARGKKNSAESSDAEARWGYKTRPCPCSNAYFSNPFHNSVTVTVCNNVT